MGSKVLRVIFAILVSALYQSAQGQKTPEISYISPEQIKDIGSTVKFQCSVRYSQDYRVFWMKIDENREFQTPISANNVLFIGDSRFALRSDASSSTYTLQIKDIQETDAGLYECKIFVSVRTTISAGVELQVRRPPIISDNSTRPAVVNEGQPDELEDQSTEVTP